MKGKTRKLLATLMTLAMVFSLFAAMPITASAAAPAPTAQIDYVNERFTNLIPGTNYAFHFFDGPGGGGNYRADLDGSVEISDSPAVISDNWFGRTVRITEVGPYGGSIGGDSQDLPIPARPAAPTGVGKTDETTVGAKDGTITGVDMTMEYKLMSSSAWISCGGTEVTGLAPGTYQVRYKAVAGTAFSSEIADASIAPGDATTYTYNTPASVTENGVTASLEFDPASPQEAGVPVQVYFTLSGTTVDEGNYTFTISSVKADFEFTDLWHYGDSESVTGDSSEESETYFTMPSENVDDFTFTFTFSPGEYVGYYFDSLSANGTDGSVTTTELTIETRHPALTASDVNILGATKGTLTPVGDDGYGLYTYTLSISNITVGNGGLVAVAINMPTSYVDTRNVAVWVAPPPSPPSGGGGGGSVTTYTVSFNTNGGSAVSNRSVNANGKLTKPADPTREGYDFAGWYTDAALTIPYDFNANVTKGLTLYAKWTEKAKEPEPITPTMPTNPFSDVRGTDWFIDDVIYAYSKGLIEGTTPTTFAPNSNLTYAQAVTLAARMHQLYTKGEVTLENSDDPWYQSYVDYAIENGIISEDLDWNAMATRAGYMQIFANALPDDAFANINNVPDGSIPDVPMDYPGAAAIYKLYRAGILQGNDTAHTCNPGANIRRSEVAAILTRMMNPEARISFSI